MRLALSTTALLVVLISIGRARADDKSDCTKAYSSGQDLRAASKLVDARAQLEVCRRPVCPSFIAHECTTWLAEVDAATPTIVFAITDSSGADVSKTARILEHENTLAETVDGTPIAIDPGQHVLRIETKDGESATVETIDVHAAEKKRLVTIVLPKPRHVAPPPRPVASVEPPVRTAPSLSSLQIAGIGIGIVGVVSLAIGSGLGLAAASRWSTAKSECTSTVTCGPGSQAQDDKASAQTMASVSTGLFVTGIVTALGGAALVLVPALSSRSSKVGFRVAPMVGLSSAGLLVSAWFP